MNFGPKLAAITGIASAMLLFSLIAFATALLPPKVVILLVGGTVTFFLTLIRVEAGLIILIFMVPWTMQYEVIELANAPFDIGTDDILILCILFGWMGFLAIHKEAPFPHSPLNWPMAAFFAVALISLTQLLLTRGFGPYSVALLHLLKWMQYNFIYFVVVRVIRNKEKVEGFLYLCIISSVIVAIAQLYLMATKQFAGIKETPWGTLYWAVPGFESNGVLGAYYVFFIGFGLAFIIGSTSRLKQGLFIGYSVLLSFCLFFTFTRAGYLGLLAVMIVIAVWSSRTASRVPLIVFMVGILSLVFLIQPVMDRILMTVHTTLGGIPTLEASAADRLVRWKNALTVLTEGPLNPIIGIGFWGSRFHGIFGFSTPHNWYLALLVETGIVGLGIFCWLLKRIIHHTIRLHRQAGDDLFLEAMTAGYLAGLIGLLTHSFFGETFESFRIAGTFWFITGIVMAATIIQEEEEDQKQEEIIRKQAAAVARHKQPALKPAAPRIHSKQFVKRFFT